MDVVPRVAVDASYLDHSVSTNLTAQLSEDVIRQVSKVIGSAFPIEHVATSVKVTGPGWSIVSVDEADRLSIQQRSSLVPIRSRSSLAMVTRWYPGALTFELCDENGNLVAVVEPDFEAKELDLRKNASSQLIGTFEMIDSSSMLCIAHELERVMSVRSPLRNIQPEAFGRVFAVGGEKSDGAAFVISSWVGDIAVRWLSQCLRVHVIHHASLPSGISRPLALNSVCLHKLSDQNKWRLSMIVHESSCRCFCNAWNKESNTIMSFGTPKRVSISIDFCGCEKIDGYCLHHPEAPGHSFDNAAVCNICLMGMTMRMSCRHLVAGQSTSIPTVKTDVKLPCNDLFAKSLLCVCRSLSKLPSEECETELREFLDTSLAETVLDYATTRSVNDDTMMERDMSVAAMLKTGQYFVAPAKRNSPKVLKQRNVRQRVPSYMNETMQTHAHLFPRS